uniref:Protein TIC 214 n=1 Tax=Korthalsella rubra TaxID=74344 RepID=A0AA96RQ58_9MAGN|nr:Ycf1 protein [Korthalsella rubra]WNR57310.1 Ycf1 protein [Korthalsella rubra]
MIYQSFRLGNLLFSLIKRIYSVVLVGLYYGFMTTFSIVPSSVFLFVGFMHPVEGTDKVSATTGFLTGQFIMLISIFSAPLYLALSRPHTITVLTLSYLLFHFFWKNHKNFCDFGYKTSTINLMRNLSIQCIFLNNNIFQILNLFLLPSSMLSRVVNIVLFRCHNKILFVTSSFIGWLIGIILFMKWIRFGYVCIRQKNSNGLNRRIRSVKNILSGTSINNLYISIFLNTFSDNITKFVGSNTYYHSRLVKNLVSELINYMSRILSILLFITCVYYLVRIPSTILTHQKRKKTSEIQEEREKSKEEKEVVEIEKTSGIKDSQEDISTKNTFRSLVLEETVDQEKILDENTKLTFETKNKKEDKKFLWLRFETLVTLLFDYQQRNRPLRYIKNDQFENDVRNEMSQYFFYTCPSDGKLKISFTYLSSLFTFLEMIQKKISLYTIDSKKQNHWRYTNEQKKNKLSNDFLKRMDALDNQYGIKKILEKRTRLCNNDKEYLKKIYDPFVNGPLRGITKKISSVPSIKEPFIENSIDRVWINKIHGIFITYSRKLQQNKKRYEAFDKNLLLIMQKLQFLTFISQFDKKTEQFTLHFWKGIFLFPKQEKMDSEYRDKKNFIFFFKRVIELKNIKSIIIQKSIGVKTICQKVPKWSYNLIDELEQQLGEEYEEIAEDHHEIRSRKAKRIVIFTDNDQKNNSSTTTTNMNNETYDPDHQVDEIALIRYSPQSDFRREIIKGTMRTQRRKTVILELFQVNTHSPLFFDRISKIFFNCEMLLKQIKFIFINKMSTISQLKNSTNNIIEERKQMDKKEKKVEEKVRIEKIAEAWETILFYQRIRGCMLIIQSIIRKYLFLPSLIIAKNFSRMLLFQSPEWSEDFKEWNREMHIKCTYNGVQLSEKEFPKNWLTDGIQIKILFPFCLKPWRSRLRSYHMDAMKKKTKKDVFCFLTVWGMEADLPFGSPRKQPSFFEPVFKTITKKIIKLIKKNFFLVIRFLIEKIDVDLRVSKKRKKWFMKNIFKRIKKNLSKKKNLLGNEDVSEIEDTKRNWMIHDSYIPRFIDYRKDSMAENKMRDPIDRNKKIKNKMITKKENQKELKKKKMDIKKKTRLRMKSYHFIINEMENSSIYIYILFIKNLKKNICTVNAQLFVESIIKMIENILFSESNQEKLNNQNQTTIDLMISTLKESISLTNCKKNPHLFCNLSLSQTYLFYQFSKIQVHKLDKFRDLFQYNGTSLFLKSEIKNLFGMLGIHSDSKLRIKVLKSETKPWKMWLVSTHSQYSFSLIRWSQRSTKWRRNRVMNQYIVFFYRCYFLYDVKVQLIHHYKKKTDSEEVSLSNKKDNVIKNYFDHNSKILKYEYNATNLIKGSPLHVRLQKKKERKNDNYKKHKQKLIDRLGPFYNYLGEDKIRLFRYIDKNLSIHINCPIKQHFFFKKLYIETLIDSDTGTNCHHLYNRTETNHPGIERIDKKNAILSLTIYQKEPSNSKIFLNWMGLNKEILINCLRSNTLSFLPDIFLDYQYKMKPWVIRIQRLCLHFNENISEKKNINTTNSKISFSLKEKDILELENTNQQKAWTGRGKRSDVQNQDSILSNQLHFEEVDTKSNRQKHRKKKYNHTETELDLFRKRYFFFQMRWDEPLNPKMIKNIKVYCLLLRLKNPKNMVLSSIQRGEISLDRMLNKDISLKELIKTGILIIEPVRQSLKKDRKFIMVYQTVTISLVRKSEPQTNPKYQEKKYIDLITFQSIEKNIPMLGKKDEKNDIDSLFFPENILSARRCREFRVRMCFYSNKNRYHNNIINLTFNRKNNIKNFFGRFMDENEHLDRKHKKNKVKKVNLFFWANYRFEDLTCMNRYWYYTNNGSHFSMLRICNNN